MEADDIEMDDLGRQEEAEAAARQIYQDEDDETFFDPVDPIDTIVPDDPVQETSFIDQGADDQRELDQRRLFHHHWMILGSVRK